MLNKATGRSIAVIDEFGKVRAIAHHCSCCGLVDRGSTCKPVLLKAGHQFLGACHTHAHTHTHTTHTAIQPRSHTHKHAHTHTHTHTHARILAHTHTQPHTHTRPPNKTPSQGTLASDGVGLLAACLSHFCEQPLPPRVLACTHYHEVFDASVLPRWGAVCIWGAGMTLRHVQARCARTRGGVAASRRCNTSPGYKGVPTLWRAPCRSSPPAQPL